MELSSLLLATHDWHSVSFRLLDISQRQQRRVNDRENWFLIINQGESRRSRRTGSLYAFIEITSHRFSVRFKSQRNFASIFRREWRDERRSSIYSLQKRHEWSKRRDLSWAHTIAIQELITSHKSFNGSRRRERTNVVQQTEESVLAQRESTLTKMDFFLRNTDTTQ